VGGEVFGIASHEQSVDAGGHSRLLPLLPKPPHEFNGIFLSKALTASEGGIAPKVKPRQWLRGEEGSHGSTQCMYEIV
jgi:hypothetical protein